MSLGCRICQGKQKPGTQCMFCGFRVEKSKSRTMTPEQRKEKEDAEFKQKCRDNEIEYFRQTRLKMIKYRMRTTGCPELDANIIKYVGDWRDQL